MVEENAEFSLKFFKLGCSEERCLVTYNRFDTFYWYCVLPELVSKIYDILYFIKYFQNRKQDGRFLCYYFPSQKYQVVWSPNWVSPAGCQKWFLKRTENHFWRPAWDTLPNWPSIFVSGGVLSHSPVLQKKITSSLQIRKRETMKNTYVSICLVSITLSTLLFFWSEHFPKIETTASKESSVTKPQFFVSGLKQSGGTSGRGWQGRGKMKVKNLSRLWNW